MCPDKHANRHTDHARLYSLTIGRTCKLLLAAFVQMRLIVNQLIDYISCQYINRVKIVS